MMTLCWSYSWSTSEGVIPRLGRDHFLSIKLLNRPTTLSELSVCRTTHSLIVGLRSLSPTGSGGPYCPTDSLRNFRCVINLSYNRQRMLRRQRKIAEWSTAFILCLGNFISIWTIWNSGYQVYLWMVTRSLVRRPSNALSTPDVSIWVFRKDSVRKK